MDKAIRVKTKNGSVMLIEQNGEDFKLTTEIMSDDRLNTMLSRTLSIPEPAPWPPQLYKRFAFETKDHGIIMTSKLVDITVEFERVTTEV